MRNMNTYACKNRSTSPIFFKMPNKTTLKAMYLFTKMLTYNLKSS